MKLKLPNLQKKENKSMEGGRWVPRSSLRRTLLRTRRIGRVFTFFIFLVIAGILWLITASNNRRNSNVVVTFPIKYVNFTGKYAFDSELPKEIKVRLSVTGFALLRFSLKPYRSDSIRIFLTDEDVRKKILSVPEGLMRDRVSSVLPGRAEILSIEPGSLQIPFSQRNSKTVPIEHHILADIRHGYKMFPIDVDPAYVYIFGSKDLLDTIKYVETIPYELNDVSKDMSFSIPLKKIPGAYISTDSVRVQIKVEELTEETFETPITILNEPVNYKVKVLPSQVKVCITIPISAYGRYKADDFEPIIDFNDVKETFIEGNTDMVSVEMHRLPETVSRYTITPARVQFILEEKKVDK